MINSIKCVVPTIVLLELLSPAQCQDIETPKRFTQGQVWFTFEIEPKTIGENGSIGGWFLRDGQEKQLWVGSGWRLGKKDLRKKWGMLTPDRKAHDFRTGITIGQKVRLTGRIDFGEVESGDESVALWIGDPEADEAIARLSSLNLSGIDRAQKYIRKGGEFDITPMLFARKLADLPEPPGMDTPVGSKTLSLSEGEKLFTQRIRPLLEAKCAGCHGDRGEEIKGGFDIRTREGLLAGGDSELPSLIPGKPDESPLFQSVTWSDPGLEMPPKENDRLTETQISDLRAWIESGAPWVEQESTEAPPVLARDFGQWTKPDDEGLVRVISSGGQGEAWTNRGYDPRRIWAFRERQHVEPPAEGHPIDAFVDVVLEAQQIAAAPKAEKKTLNRRLTYTLTGLPPNGRQLELDFDTLLKELLASPHYGERMAQHWLDVTRYADSNGFARDEVRPDAHRYRTYVIESFNADKPFDQFAREQIAGDELGIAGQEALAFLWMGPWEITSMTSAAVARQMWLDDVVNSVGVTFLGQELRCAKCHDHKFDPIPTRDYYALQAVFAGTKHHVKEGNFEIQEQELQEVAILHGGSLTSKGDRVGPGLLSAIATTANVQLPSAAKGRRSALANWIADKDNPLTARVIVNRVWAWHFGTGLVATPNVFGAVGASPSHSELLDWLANWFVENNWSIKKLNRLILTSAAWQRSTTHPEIEKVRQKDPEGKWLAVFQPRRLTAEEIRDSMLAASGELVDRVGGESFRAEINWEAAFQARRAMVKTKVLPPWEPDAKREQRHRRSIYAMRRRNVGHPLMEVMNRPPTEFSCEKRDETTVVTQAFTLFHSEFTNSRALALAALATNEHPGDPQAQVAKVFARVYSRSPSTTEATKAIAHVSHMANHHRAHKPIEQPLPTEVTLLSIVEKTGEPDPITFQLEGLKNYERDLKPWQTDPETRALSELCLVLLNSSEFLYVY